MIFLILVGAGSVVGALWSWWDMKRTQPWGDE